ncbi:hypothetical protein PPYR_11096 [Photinus pyralis]|uniref:DUF4378 domain-containing protein n=1 Tax=Photinus pyralis TaxID=7054 RepID=A0A5N4AI47_PHOPY|nr:centrosome-associated protein 350-like [Photinus pyralis]KAB0797035.1 hypothetical protein PPYR_11096 [Photinus pyralis]
MLQQKRQEKVKNVTFSDTSPSRLNRKYVAPQTSFRQCTLVKTVPGTILKMPTQTDSVVQLKKKQEAALVSDKVAKTKNEIEQLKVELEQLISRGITERKCNFQESPPRDTETEVRDIKAKTFKDNIADILYNNGSEPEKIIVPLPKSKPADKSEVLQTKKVRHYNQDVAREYIKKQREKRREEMINKRKEGVSIADLKKQRLQELRETSQKLLTKNVNRARSKERVEGINTAAKTYRADTSSERKEMVESVPQLECVSSQRIVSARSPLTFDVLETAEIDKEVAATKIQALFRGYRHRKSIIEAKKGEPTKELVCKEVQTNLYESPKPVSLPEVVPYPYNFISAVKRKLNLVAQQAKENASVVLESPVRRSPDLKSFLSDKCLNLDVKSVEHLTLRKSHTGLENGCASESDTSKNIPELSSESSADTNMLHSNKRAHSDTDEELRLKINMDRVKKLRLRQRKSVESEISERISGSKESIISFNRCNYEIASEKSEVPTEKINSSAVRNSASTVSSDKNIEDAVKENGDTYSLENKENVLPTAGVIEKLSGSQEYSSNFTSVSEVPALQPPSVSLKSSLPISSSEQKDGGTVSNRVASITLKPGEKSFVESKVKANEIHLKFEAELHLLNDFNNSLRQVMAVEKSLLELHNKKNDTAMSFHTRDTQTSFMNQQSQIATINYSRGSDVSDNDTLITTGFELSQFNSPIEESCSDNSVVPEKINGEGTFAGLSLDMFERLIKDEDARIENLKAILKIREKALVDRTKGELAWLEIQKKHLKDGGQLQEISAIKKKQRGLLIKLEHERHEMQRLKQMQKAASKERKSVLKEQRNMIKAQLSTGGTVTKIKRHAREERRHSGPIKVYNIRSQSDTVVSETSMTRKSSVTEEIVSEQRSHSVVSQISEEIILSEKLQIKTNHTSSMPTETVKRSLLMREAALQKRRKVAEEILQWHQRLLEEEKKISELEMAASSIINQAAPIKDVDLNKIARQKFKGSQLNQLWLSMTGRQEKKFQDDEVYNMSQTSLEKFCKNAKHYDKLQRRTPESRQSSILADENRSAEYLSDFESVAISCNGKIGESSESDEINTVTEISRRKTPLRESKSDTNIVELLSHSRKTETCANNSISSTHSALETSEDEPTRNVDEAQFETSHTHLGSIEQLKSPSDSLPSKEITEDPTNTSGELERSSEPNQNLSNVSEESSVESNGFLELKTQSTNTSGELKTSSEPKQNLSNISQVSSTMEPFSKINTQRGTGISENGFVSSNVESSNLISSKINTERGTGTGFHSHRTNKSESESKLPITRLSGEVRSVKICDLGNEIVNEILLKNLDVKVTLEDESKVSDLSVSNLSENVSPSRTIDSISEIEEDQVFDQESKVPSAINVSGLANTVEDSTSCKPPLTVDVSELPKVDEDAASVEDTRTKSPTDSKSNTLAYEDAEVSKSEEVEEEVIVNEETCQSSVKPAGLLLSSYGFIEGNRSDTIESISEFDEKVKSTEEEEGNETDVSKDGDLLEQKSNIPSLERDKDTSSETEQSISEESKADQKSNEVPSPSLALSLESKEDKTSQLEQSVSDDNTPSGDLEASISEKVADEKQIDVKKRVLEILSDANISSPRGDRSPRMQDFYVTAYDVASAENSPNSASPTEDAQSSFGTQNVTDEVEELLKKQIAIEREIKEIQQQQKEHLPYLYVREIPNKPPPPYTPPVTKQQTNIKDSILPIGEAQIDVITKATSEILHKAFKENNIRNITLSDNAKKILDLKHNVSAHCFQFVFDLSKETAIDHYKQFEPETGPSWMHLQKRTKLAIGKPLDQSGLDKLIKRKIKQMFGFETVKAVESKKHKWSGKKRDHVDELLVIECQSEEAEWTNYDRDELIVKDELTKEIFNMLLSETGQVLSNILKKKNLS